MELARRSVAVVALAVCTAAYGALLDVTLPILGACLVGSWLVGRQFAFVDGLDAVASDLTVTQFPTRTSAHAGETDRLFLTATMREDDAQQPDADDTATDVGPPVAHPVTISVAAGVPTAAVTADPLTAHLDPSVTERTVSTTVEWPVPGRHTFEPATVTVDDGWFVGTLAIGDRPTVTVDARRPRSIHVGEGGDRFATAVGTRREGRRGDGLEAAELREYVSGDAAARIDWKATARLATPYVREYEAETDRRTVLVVDTRPSLSIGPPAQTPLADLSSVALAIAASARRHGDPLGLVVVGDGGVESRIQPGAANDRVRGTLLDIAASDGSSTTGRSPATTTTGPVSAAASHHDGSVGASLSMASASARSASGSLDGDSTFDRTLQPFYTDRMAYVERVTDAPLFAAVEETLVRESGHLWTVVLTDDTHRAELQETVTNARTRGDGVLVAIAPAVLYDATGFDRLDRAYDRYLDFERFRRALASQPDVTALEVGPADRLDAILAAGGDRA
ncbi:DUF58 domain-containing protein [Halovivax cerinus]|uniref:DUF58 domain-containing protein n=1 Tax=Halovivax cerinus TaxID=1487865 RepID=A0ABD5NRR5_9EURY|nr:DUF58 domain-containing protein [Halovivax cerinus]